MNSAVVTVKQGILEGFADEKTGSLSWLGVPFAEPPVGELRFRLPEPARAWEGVRAAKEFAPCSLQRAKDGSVIGSEDCLYLNVWRPAGDDTNLPVFFFLHGGNNQTGSGADLNGALFAQKLGAVVVSPNMRLNGLGWLNLPALKTGDPAADSGNLGLLDIKLALDWTRENAATFGGNPDNITACGYSSGGRNLLCMLLSPLFAGAFARTLTFSSGFTTTDPDYGMRTDAKALAPLFFEDGLAASAEEAEEKLLSRDPADCAKVKEWLCGLDGGRFGLLMAGAAIRMRVFPHLFADGFTLPAEGFGNISLGKYYHVPMLFLSGGNEFVFQANNDAHFKGKDLSDPANADLRKEYEFTARYGSALFGYTNAEHNAEEFFADPGRPVIYTGRNLWGMNPEVTDKDAALFAGGSHGLDLYLLMNLERDDYAVNENFWHVKNRAGRDALRECYFTYLRNYVMTGNPNDCGPSQEKDGCAGLPAWLPWESADCGHMMYFDADCSKAHVSCTEKLWREPEIFEEIRQDGTIPEERKQWILKNVLNARFFSGRLDKEFA